MSDGVTSGSGGKDEGVVEHQSIVSRILEYQRQLREGDPPPPPVETLPEGPMMEFVAAESLPAEGADLVDLTEAEAVLAGAAALAGETAPDSETADQATSPDDPVEAEIEDDEVAPVVRLEPPATSVWAVPEPPERPERDRSAQRLAELEDALRSVSQTVAELRQRFQDMAVASDERLAELEKIVERALRSSRV